VSGLFRLIRHDGNCVEERFLESIAEQLTFRGLDGKSVWLRDNVGGCFTLIRTGPAPQASQQPVTRQNRYRLWGDVRLDERQELQKQLAENGSAVEANANSEELLLCAWEKWGEAS
jgi:asparagine synthetase B (glutamine-hydrolysing)